MRFVDLPADLDELHRALEQAGWGDGLPVIPPTEARVAAMLAGEDPETSLGPMPPSGHELTLGLVAANAVMAGCRPPLFGLVRAIAGALLAPELNLLGVQTTTHPAAPMAIVSGLDHLGINSGAGVLGPGAAANATVGRAVRLLLLHVGGARPGTTDQATMGHPGKYTYVVGEHLAASPWGPFALPGHDDLPAARVTVFAGEGPHNVSDHSSTDAAGIMASLVGTIAQPGMNNWYHPRSPFVVLLSPEHAHLLAREGVSRRDVAAWIARDSALAIEAFTPSLRDGLAKRRLGLDPPVPAGARVHAFEGPDQVLVVVTGGPGRHSMVVPSFGNTQAVQRAVTG